MKSPNLLNRISKSKRPQLMSRVCFVILCENDQNGSFVRACGLELRCFGPPIETFLDMVEWCLQEK